ncbi:hypothetical protein M4578_16685, partial [Salipiger sp. P9]|uniref:hypothetical protein n=1 Tax=Salipiger pentaromativorans TaxID=2943193 RepID=UPI002157EA4C
RAQNRSLYAKSKPDCMEIGTAKTVDQTFLCRLFTFFTLSLNNCLELDPTNAQALQSDCGQRRLQ